MRVTHEAFGAYFDEHSQVLILGSVPSPKSREYGFYYAHPQNRFWRVLPALFGEPPLTGDIFAQKQFLTRHHIALWDVLDSCDIEGASDATIRNPVANDMNIILRQAPIRAIFATGAKAAQLYKKHCQPQCGVPVRQLPSTSPANCAVKFDALCEKYSVIKTILEQG